MYGPRQREDSEASVIPAFLGRIRQRKPLVIHGNGRQVRDFIYVEDAVEATVLAAEVKRVSGKIVNVGTGKAASILALARQLTTLADKSKPRVIHEKPRSGDIFRSCADTFKAKATLGFEATTALEEGLKMLIQWVAA